MIVFDSQFLTIGHLAKLISHFAEILFPVKANDFVNRCYRIIKERNWTILHFKEIEYDSLTGMQEDSEYTVMLNIQNQVILAKSNLLVKAIAFTNRFSLPINCKISIFGN